MNPVAMAAVGDKKNLINWLVGLSVLIALFESATLFLIFSFVSTLMGKSYEVGALGLLMETFGAFQAQTQAVVLLVVSTLRFALSLVLEWRMSHLWVSFRADMQIDMLHRHFNATHAFLQSHKQGEHVHNIMTGPSMGAVYYLHYVRFVSTFVMLVALLLTLFIISPELSLLGIVVAIIYGGVVRRISMSVSFKQGQLQAAGVRRQTEMATEGLSGIRYIKVMGHEEIWHDEFRRYAVTARDANHKASFANTVPMRTLEYLVVVLFLSIVLLMLGGEDDINDLIPTAAAYFLGIVRILPILSILGNGRMQMMNVLPYLQKYVELKESIEQEDAVVSPEIKPINLGPTLLLEDVGFAYGEQEVFHGFNLQIDTNGFTAIVGASGQGKSTLLDLMLRIAVPSRGKISTNGKPSDNFNLPNWRSLFAYVGQDPFLFHDTVLNNILAGNTHADMDRVVDAARTACIHDFIQSLPQGYNTVLSDRGHSLSGGQRQRLALARALVSDAELLLLDEPTSALDSQTELEVMSGLKNTWQGGIVLVTHRLELIRKADVILVLGNGQVMEQGTFTKLEAEGQLFNEIFKAQFKPVLQI